MLYNNDPDFVAGGTPLGYEIIDGQMVFRNTSPVEPPPKSLNKIKSDTVNHTGFSKSKVVNGNEKFVSPPSEKEKQRQELLDRLAILQNTEARLLKDLERTRSVIKSIKSDLSI